MYLLWTNDATRHIASKTVAELEGEVSSSKLVFVVKLEPSKLDSSKKLLAYDKSLIPLLALSN